MSQLNVDDSFVYLFACLPHLNLVPEPMKFLHMQEAIQGILEVAVLCPVRTRLIRLIASFQFSWLHCVGGRHGWTLGGVPDKRSVRRRRRETKENMY